ncbi:MAG TPA: choice-of-anchor tandem repeat GloVer-containing protein [Terracidiphilus sp.]|jgi:uncharacterized repeat protein (TIGR03803 family)
MLKSPILATAMTFATLISAGHAQTYSAIYSFKGADFPDWTETLSQSPGGYLLFTLPQTDGHPELGQGIAFELSTGGWFHTLHTFDFTDGRAPLSGLILGTDQRLHGTTAAGGANNYGTVFRLSPDGTVVTEHNFSGGKDGQFPNAVPMQSLSGDWYGVTSSIGGSNDFRGTIYRISTGGAYTLLHTFTGPDGAVPYGPLIEGSDGLLYGTTNGGGANGFGTVFTISPDGTLKTLHSFNGTDGKFPFNPLIQAHDGNFYGIAEQGGAAGAGVVFRITPAGTYSVLHDFSGGLGGLEPMGGLLEATDGNLYGTASQGGSSGGATEVGILFRLTLSGAFTKVLDFNHANGYSPVGQLHQHTDGKIYGYTFFGGTHDSGAIYKCDVGLGPFVAYLPIYGRAGVKVTILGQNFQNNSLVYFNGVQAQQVEIHSTYLKAIVPDGATTGPITVQTSSAGRTLVLKSNKDFVVH